MRTTDTIREQSLSIVECDVPAELTLHQYRHGRREASRQGRARVGLPGAGLIGIVTETWLTHRKAR